MAKSDNLQPVGPEEQPLFSKGAVTDQGIGGPSDDELTDAGRRLLDTWADALSKTGDTIAAFLRRYEQGAERKGATT